MKSISRRKLCTSSAIALTSATIISSRASAAEVIRVANPPAYTPLVTTLVAQDAGYFAEQGITAEVTTYNGGAAAQAALAAGAADLSPVASPGAAIAIKKGVKQRIVALAGPPSPQGWYLLVPQHSTVRDVKELQGQKVAITGKGSSTDFFVSWSAKEAGISIMTIPLGTGIEPALRADQVAAGVLWPIASFQAVSSGEFRLLADYGALIKNTSMDVWVASEQMINQKADILKRWAMANKKALSHLQSDRPFALKYLARYQGTDDQKILGMAYDLLIRPMRANGAPNPTWIGNALALAALAGITDLPKASDIIDPRFVPTTT